MGFFQKLKDFGSKVVHGIRKGWDFVRDKVAPVVRKVLPIAQKGAAAIGTALGHPEVAGIASKVGDVVDKGLSFIGR